MKTALVMGATGMVGSFVLKELLGDSSVSKIICIGRRKTGIEHKKVKEFVHADFLDFSSLKNELKDIDVCIYCLAVYLSTVSKDDYFTITCDYQKELTDVLEEVRPDATFVLFSAMGADTSEKSTMTFARAKGKAENLLMKTGFPKKYILRPGYIHATGSRKPPGLGYRIGWPFFGFFLRCFQAAVLLIESLQKQWCRLDFMARKQ